MDSLIPQSSEESFKLVEEVDKPGEIETDLVVENIFARYCYTGYRCEWCEEFT